jgi:PPOX class probable F420-dependent enzyme
MTIGRPSTGNIKIPAEHQDLLQRALTGILTTVLPDGGPHASPVWFNFEDGSVIVATTRDRVKVRDITRDPRVSFTVFDPEQTLHYVELWGRAAVGNDVDNATLHRVARRPDGPAFIRPGTERIVVTITPAHMFGQ